MRRAKAHSRPLRVAASCLPRSSSTWPSPRRRRSSSPTPAPTAPPASRRASRATRRAPSAASACSLARRTKSTTTPTPCRCCSAPRRSASSTAWRRPRASPAPFLPTTWTSSSTTRSRTSTSTSPSRRHLPRRSFRVVPSLMAATSARPSQPTPRVPPRRRPAPTVWSARWALTMVLPTRSRRASTLRARSSSAAPSSST